jgi:hypothetical protein
MPDDPYLDYFPDGESQSTQKSSQASRSDLPGGQGDSSEAGIPGAEPANSTKKSRLLGIWEGITRAGMADTTLRLGTHALLVALILIVAWAMREFYLHAQVAQTPRDAVLAAELPDRTGSGFAAYVYPGRLCFRYTTPGISAHRRTITAAH